MIETSCNDMEQCSRRCCFDFSFHAVSIIFLPLECKNVEHAAPIFTEANHSMMPFGSVWLSWTLCICAFSLVFKLHSNGVIPIPDSFCGRDTISSSAAFRVIEVADFGK